MTTENNGPDATDLRIAEAKKAHARGWALTPLRGKKPIKKGWQKAPKPDLAAVEQMARDGNVGLRTGAISEVVVIDDDTPDGSGAAALNLPKTVTVITGSGKRHCYFKYPARGIKNSVSKVADHVDIRGDGGQVVFPGSIHPETGKPYMWASGLSPDDVPLAELPLQVLHQLAKPVSDATASNANKKPSARDEERLHRYAQAALRNAVGRVAATPEGQRNDRLNAEAFALGKLISAGLLTKDEVVQALAAAAHRCGLPDEEARHTIEAATAAGEADPKAADELLQKLLRPSSRSHPPRPSIVITVEGGILPEIVDQAEDAMLRDGGEELFQFGASIVRLVRTTDPIVCGGVMRPIGAIAMRPVDATYVVERFTLAANFEKQTSKGPVRIDCPEAVARTYLAREGRWRLRKITGVIEAPTLRPNGTAIDQPGFDVETGLFLDFAPGTFPPIPAAPTIDDARGALSKLQFVIRDFPFVSEADRSAALAAILTPPVRRSLRAAPLFPLSAPKPGSGKSLLADIVSLIATGRDCAVMSQGRDENEDRKRMLALLLEGDPVLCIDNIELPLCSAALCSVLTQTKFKDRILGYSRTATVSTAVTWIANGNNLQLAGDLTTRSVPCELVS